VRARKGWTTGCIFLVFFLHILRYIKKTLTTVGRNSPQTSPLNWLESWRTGIKTRTPNRTRLYGRDLRCSCNQDGFISPNLQRNTDDVVNTAHYSLFERLAVVGEEDHDATLWWLQGFPSANAFWKSFHGGCSRPLC
jgi:hypothetical protein